MCKAAVKCHHQQRNTPFFIGRMPFLSLNQQQCQITEGNTELFYEIEFLKLLQFRDTSPVFPAGG